MEESLDFTLGRRSSFIPWAFPTTYGISHVRTGSTGEFGPLDLGARFGTLGRLRSQPVMVGVGVDGPLLQLYRQDVRARTCWLG